MQPATSSRPDAAAEACRGTHPGTQRAPDPPGCATGRVDSLTRHTGAAILPDMEEGLAGAVPSGYSGCKGVMRVPGIFCTRCGFENSTSRGACLMCDNMLAMRERGAACPGCGEDNARYARFCGSCGTAIEAGVVAAPIMVELATRVLEAVGGGVGVGAGAAEDYEDEGDFAETGEDDLVGESMAAVEETSDFGPTTEAAPPGFTKAPADAEAADEAAIPGPILDEPAPEPAAEIEPDEDFAPPPPPGVVQVEEEEEEDFAPPPPPGVVEPEAEEDEDFAPPPPPGVVAPAADAEPDEDEFAPPPPPPGVVDTTEEEELPPVTETAPAQATDEDEEDADFGAWELDFEEEQQEDQDKDK